MHNMGESASWIEDILGNCQGPSAEASCIEVCAFTRTGQDSGTRKPDCLKQERMEYEAADLAAPAKATS